MSRYLLRPSARRDLDEIWTFTEQTWGRVQATRYVLTIRDACEELATGKRRGRTVDQIRRGYRRVTVGSHFVFYLVKDNGDIDVVRILHQRMNITARLSQRD